MKFIYKILLTRKSRRIRTIFVRIPVTSSLHAASTRKTLSSDLLNGVNDATEAIASSEGSLSGVIVEIAATNGRRKSSALRQTPSVWSDLTELKKLLTIGLLSGRRGLQEWFPRMKRA